MLDLLKNEIVVNWIAPIITGLIVIAIPAIAIKIFRFKKDEKAIKQANQRFIDSIIPFIIQKISINSSYISDVRSVVIEESGLKDKYVYSEISLRNKLIMDISESKYIDEENKKELIDFTYNTFKHFENKEDVVLSEEHESKKLNTKGLSYLTSNPLILLIISQFLISLVVIFDKRNIKPEENILIMLPFLLGFISIVGVVLMIISKLFESSVSNKKHRDEIIYRNYINHRNEMVHGINKLMKEKNSKKIR